MASLALVAAFTATLVFLGPNRSSNMVGPGVTTSSVARPEPDIRITLSDDTTEDELNRAVAEVMTLDGVAFAQGLNRDAAFAEFSEMFAECPGLVEVAAQDLSAFPIAIKVWVDPDSNIGDDTEVVDVANRVLVAMTQGGFGLVDIELTRDTPPAQNDCISPTTTMAVPAQLEQAGTDLQSEITADGYVSRDEFVRAVEGMAACMTDHGLTGVNWSVDEVGGGWSMGYDSPTDDPAEQAIYALCYYSYIPQMELRGEAPTPEVATLHPVRITCVAELSESYPCSALIDGDPTTTWQAPDGGIGVTITFMFAEPVQITDLAFENEPGDAYRRNARARGVVVTTDDLSQPIEFELTDTNASPQVFDIRSLRTSELTVRITSGYPGQSVGDQAPFTDLALGEITFRGRISPPDEAAAELETRCQAADQVVATYEARIGGSVGFGRAWMVESADTNLEAWYFISTMVEGGPLDGQIATWQYPAFGGTVDPVNTPNLSIPANDVAASFDIGTSPALLRNVQPATYGFSSWSEVEGFELSQRCLGLGAES